ncbi:MAG TPA: YceI family protein [Pseudonocardiaceae bacterium]|nr:YceI family protein [Pseudonocardiaceae bacterium]
MNPASPSMARRGVTAQARTTDGWPVASAVLTVTDTLGAQVARVLADEDGRLATEPLPAGTYTAILTAGGFDPMARTALVTGSGSAALGVLSLARTGDDDLPAPGSWTIDPAHTLISVTARHLGMASVRGRFAEFGGRIEVTRPVERSTVTATIQAASIDTGSKMRDDHLRSADFLGVDEHPVIEYRGSSLTSLGGQKWRVDGELTLNGITRAVPLALDYLGVGPDSWGGTRAAFRVVTELRRDDFAITYNQVVRAGITLIGTTLRVEIDVQAVLGDVLPGQ